MECQSATPSFCFGLPPLRAVKGIDEVIALLEEEFQASEGTKADVSELADDGLDEQTQDEFLGRH